MGTRLVCLTFMIFVFLFSTARTNNLDFLWVEKRGRESFQASKNSETHTFTADFNNDNHREESGITNSKLGGIQHGKPTKASETRQFDFHQPAKFGANERFGLVSEKTKPRCLLA